MKSTNCTGPHLAVERHMMERFDRLPKPVRQALANARTNFGIAGVPEYLAQAGAEQTVAEIARIDLFVCARDAAAVWGDGFDHVGRVP